MRECPDCEQPMHGTTCRRCGWSPPSVAPASATSRPWTPPTYPALTPEDDALIRAEIARARALLGMPPTREDAGPARPARLPPVDPALRAECDRRNAAGPEPVGAIVRRVPGR